MREVACARERAHVTRVRELTTRAPALALDARQGCFHVPRALLYCEQAFAALLARAGEGE